MSQPLHYLLAVLAIVFVIDFALRALPFMALKPLRESDFVMNMGQWMPAGILMILAVVTLTQHSVSLPGYGWAAFAAGAITVASHLLSGRRMMVSILVGTASYVALINLF